MVSGAASLARAGTTTSPVIMSLQLVADDGGVSDAESDVDLMHGVSVAEGHYKLGSSEVEDKTERD